MYPKAGFKAEDTLTYFKELFGLSMYYKMKLV